MIAAIDLIQSNNSDSTLVSNILTYLKSKAKYNKIRIIKRSVYFEKNHVTLKMLVGKEEIEGSGCADTKNDAALKAVMELFERYIFLTQKVEMYQQTASDKAPMTLESIYSANPVDFASIATSTTNGMAAHTSLLSSLSGAMNEAIERHVLLKAMALNIKPKMIDFKSYNVPIVTEPILIKKYLWKGPLGKYIIAIKANFDNANCYGFGCSDDLNGAIEKAKCEIAPRMNVLRRKKTYAHLKLRDNEHFDYHLQKLSPWANDFFNTGFIVNVPEIDIDLGFEDFWFGEYNMPEDLNIKNISVVRAVSPKLQPLFKGHWSIEKMNVGAFERKSLLDLPKELHVVG